MKKLILILISLVSTITINAQGPTLNSSNAGYAIGDVYNYRTCDSTSVTAGGSGAGVTWDFSILDITGNQTSQFCLAPSATPYFSNFPTANTTLENPTGYYSYYLSNSSEVTLVGEGNTSFTTVYSDPQKLFNFPFFYGSDFTDNLAATYTSVGVVYTRSGTSRTNADGWGILKLSGQTFNNVLRVKITQNITDQSINGTLISYMQLYFWYDGIHKAPVLSIYDCFFSYGGTNFNSLSVEINSDVVGVVDPVNMTASVSLFPNPASDKITLKIQQSNSLQNSFISVYDLAGQLLMQQPISKQQTEIDISNLAKGVYILKLNTNSNAKVIRFVKE